MTGASRLLALALAVGLVARIALALTHGPLASDEQDYDRLGWTLATTGKYSENGSPTAYRSIGYPAFIAGIYALAGRSPRAVQAVQVALDLATALLLYGIAARRSRRAGIAAGSIWALYPAAILFSGLHLSETVYVFLLVLFTWLVVRTPKRAAGTIFAGALLGTLIVLKPGSLVFAVLLAPILLRGGLGARSVAILLATATVVVVPWVVRNSVVLRRPVLSTSLGPNLLIGNNPNATGAYGPALVPERVRNARGEVAVDFEARNAALQFITTQPGRFLTLAMVKCALVISSDAEVAVGRFTRRDPSSFASYRDRYRSLAVGIHAVVSLPYFALVLAGILGLVLRPNGIERSVFAALVVSVLLVHAATFGGSRFHFPWMPFFALFAARLADGWRGGLSTARPLAVTVGVAAMAIAVAVWVTEAWRLAG